MGSPFNAGRDSNNPGFGFAEQADVDDSHASAMEHGFTQRGGSRLSEADYRDAENKT